MSSNPVHLAWLQELTNPAVTVALDLVGFPSPMRQTGAWDTGWLNLQEHLIYHLLGDPCILHTASGASTEVAGTWIWLPPDVRFRFTLAQRTGSALYQRFRLRVVRGGERLSMQNPPVIIREAWSMSEPMSALVQEVDQDDAYADARRRALLTLLFSEAFRLGAPHGTPGHRLSQAQRMHLRMLVRQHLPEWLTPGDLAHELGLSADYFTRVFSRSLGIAPRTWLMQERIHCAAANLTESTETIAAIAEAHGYSNPTLFGRQFARVMGCSPVKWRERNRVFRDPEDPVPIAARRT
jgi:AraC-like DNA-binding protein